MKTFSVQDKIDRTIFREGKEYLYFSGTAYLGIGAVDAFSQLVIEGIKKHGINHGASRSGNVQLAIYDEMESYFAKGASAERALLFSSGYLAGMAAVSYIQKTSDLLLVAPDTHPAILPSGLELDASQSFSSWIADCSALCAKVAGKRISILANAVDPLVPEIHAFEWIKTLNPQNHYSLLVDDSHAFGVLGEKIFGTYSLWKDLPVDLMVSGSLGKGLGIPVGIVLGDSGFIQGLEKGEIFRTSSPPPPAFCKAFLDGQKIFEAQKIKLMDNLNIFLGLVSGMDGLSWQDGFPVFSFPDDKWVDLLEQEKIIVSSFPYPKPTDPSVNRIILSAYHRIWDLERLASALKSIAGT